MKKTILFSIAALLSAHQTIKTEHVILKNPILNLIDGKSYAIDGKVFGLILQVRRELRKRVLGVKSDNGQFIGIYELNGEQHSITELVMLEAQLDATYYTELSVLEKKKNNGSQEEYVQTVQEINEKYQERRKQLNDLLDFAKEDFLEITKGYADNIRPFKDQILVLILESCQKHGKESCFLLKWSEESDGNEGKFLRAEIITFKGLQDFCTDLANYLEDMAYSCPKGKQLFIDMIKQAKEQK
ncbi:hypothetical protein KAH94_03400 [bacterium]|nr:hypothetical protein [bacterium]